MADRTGSAKPKRTMERDALRPKESVVYSRGRYSDRNPLVRTRFLGGVGGGRSTLPATRLGNCGIGLESNYPPASDTTRATSARTLLKDECAGDPSQQVRSIH